MTRDRARKQAIRSRMATSGERYSDAARNLGSARLAGKAVWDRVSTPPDVDTGVPPVLELAAWTDGQHIRRAQFRDGPRDDPQPGLNAASVRKVRTVELWDFGVSVQELDWSRLPGVPGAG